MNFARPWRSGAALVALALILSFCGGGGDGGSTSSSPCPLTQFSSRKFLDASTAVGLNAGADSADSPHLAELGGKIYIAWSEYITADGTDEIQVSVFNGDSSAPSWTRVVGAGNGLNKSSSSSGQNPKLISFNGKLYATWVEDAAGPSVQIRAAVYNGNDSSPAWTFVDGGGASGLNKSSAQFGSNPEPVVFNSKLYLVWSETNAGFVSQIRAVVYGGDDASPAWTFVDGNGANGLNKDVTKDAERPTVAEYNGKLYLAWQETNGSNVQARVAVYNGNDSSPSWSKVDGNGTNGLNFSSSQNASYLRLVASARDLALYWRETSTSGAPLRVRLYNGVDSGPYWYVSDGGANGLSVAGTVATYPSVPFMLGYYLMAGWMESTGSGRALRLGYYSNAWNYLASSNSANLNVDSTMDAANPTALVTSTCKVYVGWVETDNNLGVNLVHTAILQ